MKFKLGCERKTVGKFYSHEDLAIHMKRVIRIIKQLLDTHTKLNKYSQERQALTFLHIRGRACMHTEMHTDIQIDGRAKLSVEVASRQKNKNNYCFRH